MTLKDLLKDYFNTNTDEASQALYQELEGYQGWGEDKDTYHPSDFEVWAELNGVSRPIFVDHYGGEDQGSNYYTIYKFTRGDETVFIKFYGYYASYNGTDYEGFVFVNPKEKTVVVYE